ncbi:hypothetical protein C8R45DRAFT_1103445 [Mycena sanguinolenta]|nr:hypothetical protein C8R45DRAFT_1103445 [Mycena sanguinolenta]
MSAPALLAEALSRRREALQAYGDGLDTVTHNIYSPVSLVSLVAVVQEADRNSSAARATANDVAKLLLSYHCLPPPPSEDMPAILSAMHKPSFADLAQLAECSNYSGPMILELRRAYRAQHEQEENDPIPLNSDDILRIIACTTFGKVAEILENERHVSDAVFETIRLL